MSSQFLRRLTARPATGFLRTPLRSTRIAPASFRFYAASPGQSSNVGNPTASSAESQGINQSRAMESKSGSPDTASLATPAHADNQGGMSEEPSGAHENIRQDPNKPDEEKAKQTLKQGEKPLDPADK
ncbi:hypothetical protein H2201_001500 [Coniosporium apollinis]|uniref:Uncharacterized protein n=2 Tax=Coniosporium TaxID=2810619 RepID=A0ABQ9P7V5_9PEZI|nr:hypothetical protein H2199_001101 [Cladosporium sp. JES 115]KAJ9668452.1 hypothetical protein H2201_001500 [Coniosporium apollinis]